METEPKDLFSQYSKEYSAFRPTYQKPLYDFIFSHVKNFDTAWDCATGNGQAAKELAVRFKQVQATDISTKQIENAAKQDNIFYSVGQAEKTLFADNSFDLITVAQAIHWINFDLFYSEVVRVAKPSAVLAVWGYSLLSIDPIIDEALNDFYVRGVGSYWDKERKFIDEKYQTIPLPFEEIQSPQFEMTFEWTLEQLVGYINTWSAVRKFIDANHFNPVDKLREDIRPHWKEERKLIRFPLFLRLGIIKK
jgi:ubiquinone/menaquinone biosynthesis C-methylase UbiE